MSAVGETVFYIVTVFIISIFLNFIMFEILKDVILKLYTTTIFGFNQNM